MLDNTIALVLAGGAGSRLAPLTADRAKPAVPFGGKYRIIDFTLSNCHHSGLRRILVLTQYKSHSLQKHLRDGWSIFNPSIGEYITPIPPQMRTGDSWYLGTADAVYQNIYLIARSGAELVLVLSGDHIYRMDYAALIEFHLQCNSHATIACMKVPRAEGSAFGVLAVDAQQRVVAFQEKPAQPPSIPNDSTHALVSMGIYVFSRQLLCDVLEDDSRRNDSSHDFGRDILPALIASHRVYGYPFAGNSGRVTSDGYWRDVGTLDAYFDANMDLLKPNPPIDLYQPDWPIRTTERQGPPARTVIGPSGCNSRLENSLVASGIIIAGGVVENSILCHDVVINETAHVDHSILLDNVRVGPGAKLHRCIIDKNVRIPANARIGLDNHHFPVSDGGVVVVPKNYRFPDDSSS